MRALGVWTRAATATATAVALLAIAAPAEPSRRLPWPLQLAVGVAAGAALFLVAVRRVPRLGFRRVPWALGLARCGLLAVLAADEEILWRRVALGELLRSGAVAALAASTVAFALAHRARPALHLLTGATFGAVYLATGALVASVSAHWSYNVLVASAVRLSEQDGAPA
jgi:membrane protease YdiL (CAAX protease family)